MIFRIFHTLSHIVTSIILQMKGLSLRNINYPAQAGTFSKFELGFEYRLLSQSVTLDEKSIQDIASQLFIKVHL